MFKAKIFWALAFLLTSFMTLHINHLMIKLVSLPEEITFAQHRLSAMLAEE
jgi:hypothetical protein